MSREAHGLALVLVAAGRGERLGAGRNKALVEVAGRPLLAHALERALLGLAPFEAVVVHAPGEEEEQRAAIAQVAADLQVRLVEGGARRIDSVRLGVAAVSPDAELVAVHDAARAFAPPALGRRLVEAARRTGAAAPVLRPADSLHRLEEDRLVGPIDREGVAAAQTPQVFSLTVLRRALAEAERSDGPLTDEASIVSRLGLARVTAVPGDPLAFKITTPFDLDVARALAAAGRLDEAVPP